MLSRRIIENVKWSALFKTLSFDCDCYFLNAVLVKGRFTARFVTCNNKHFLYFFFTCILLESVIRGLCLALCGLGNAVIFSVIVFLFFSLRGLLLITKMDTLESYFIIQDWQLNNHCLYLWLHRPCTAELKTGETAWSSSFFLKLFLCGKLNFHKLKQCSTPVIKKIFEQHNISASFHLMKDCFISFKIIMQTTSYTLILSYTHVSARAHTQVVGRVSVWVSKTAEVLNHDQNATIT